MKTIIRRVSLLLVLVFTVSVMSLSMLVSASTIGETSDGFSDSLGLESAKYLSPTMAISDDLLQPNTDQSSIEISFNTDSNNNCFASGAIIINGESNDFSVEGRVTLISDSGQKLAFACMNGMRGSDPITMVLAHDYNTNQHYISVSIGRLSATEVPLELIFGEVTQEFSDFYGQCAENTNINADDSDSFDSIAPRISTDNISHMGNDSGYLPNGKKCIVLSSYANQTAVRNTNITVGAKITTDSTTILNYLKTSDSTSKGLNIPSLEIETGSSNSSFRNVDYSPDKGSNSITIYVPYLSINIGPSASLATAGINYTFDSISVTRSPSNNPRTVTHNFKFSTLYYPLWSSIDWGSYNPENAPKGIGVTNVFTYTGNVGSSPVRVPINTSASTTMGYYTVLSNGRNSYHTFAMDDLSVSGSVSVRDAA